MCGLRISIVQYQAYKYNADTITTVFMNLVAEKAEWIRKHLSRIKERL